MLQTEFVLVSLADVLARVGGLWKLFASIFTLIFTPIIYSMFLKELSKQYGDKTGRQTNSKSELDSMLAFIKDRLSFLSYLSLHDEVK